MDGEPSPSVFAFSQEISEADSYTPWTVGIAGVYALGVGNTPPSSAYGLSAGKVFSLQIVLAGLFVSVAEKRSGTLLGSARLMKAESIDSKGTHGIITSVI